MLYVLAHVTFFETDADEAKSPMVWSYMHTLSQTNMKSNYELIFYSSKPFVVFGFRPPMVAKINGRAGAKKMSHNYPSHKLSTHNCGLYVLVYTGAQYIKIYTSLNE